MKVLVCGSRSWTKDAVIRARIARLPLGTTIISGAARGADQMAAMIGRSLGFDVLEFPVDWKPDGVYNAEAGKERNLLMLDQRPDLVLAFWLNRSTGTAHTITNAYKRGIPVEIYS